MGPAMRVLSRWVREFVAGVDAGHAIRLGLPVRRDVVRDCFARGAAARERNAGVAAPASKGRA